MSISGAFKSVPTSAVCTSASTTIPLTYTNVGLVTDGSGVGVACSGTLANGTVGQELRVYCQAVGSALDSVIVSATTPVGWTKITWAASPLGKSATFVYTTSGWVVLSNQGGTLA